MVAVCLAYGPSQGDCTRWCAETRISGTPLKVIEVLSSKEIGQKRQSSNLAERMVIFIVLEVF